MNRPDKRLRDAIRHFWTMRRRQAKKQGQERGKRMLDEGRRLREENTSTDLLRSSVTFLLKPVCRRRMFIGIPAGNSQDFFVPKRAGTSWLSLMDNCLR